MAVDPDPFDLGLLWFAPGLGAARHPLGVDEQPYQAWFGVLSTGEPMIPLTLAEIADPDEGFASFAFRDFAGPALWAAVVRCMRRAKPGACVCRPDRPPILDAMDDVTEPWCDGCAGLWTTLLHNGFTTLRATLAGKPPLIAKGSGKGTEVREWRIIADHIRAPEARDEEAGEFGIRLRDFSPHDPTPPDLLWLRAAWAQLAYHVTAKRVEADARRESAAERGVPVRPEVAVCTAAWAEPLRADPVDRDILIEFLLGIRDEISDPYSLVSMELRFGLTPQEVDVRLRRSLALLAQYNRDFYDRAVTGPLTHVGGDAAYAFTERPRKRGQDVAGGPSTVEELAATEADARIPRDTILRELGLRDRPAGGNAQIEAQQPDQTTIRLLQVILDAAAGRRVDLVLACRRILRLDDEVARREIARMAGLVAAAGVLWVDALLGALTRENPS